MSVRSDTDGCVQRPAVGACDGGGRTHRPPATRGEDAALGHRIIRGRDDCVRLSREFLAEYGDAGSDRCQRQHQRRHPDAGQSLTPDSVADARPQ